MERLSRRLMFQCLFWWIGNNSVRQWLADLVLGHIKLFSTQLFYSNYFLLLFIYIFFIFLQLKKNKSNSLVTVWYALRLSQQPTVSLNYSQSIKINMAPSDGGTIISSSNRPTVIYLRLTDFKRTFWN